MAEGGKKKKDPPIDLLHKRAPEDLYVTWYDSRIDDKQHSRNNGGDNARDKRYFRRRREWCG